MNSVNELKELDTIKSSIVEENIGSKVEQNFYAEEKLYDNIIYYSIDDKNKNEIVLIEDNTQETEEDCLNYENPFYQSIDCNNSLLDKEKQKPMNTEIEYAVDKIDNIKEISEEKIQNNQFLLDENKIIIEKIIENIIDNIEFMNLKETEKEPYEELMLNKVDELNEVSATEINNNHQEDLVDKDTINKNEECVENRKESKNILNNVLESFDEKFIENELIVFSDQLMMKLDLFIDDLKFKLNGEFSFKKILDLRFNNLKSKIKNSLNLLAIDTDTSLSEIKNAIIENTNNKPFTVHQSNENNLIKSFSSNDNMETKSLLAPNLNSLKSNKLKLMNNDESLNENNEYSSIESSNISLTNIIDESSNKSDKGLSNEDLCDEFFDTNKLPNKSKIKNPFKKLLNLFKKKPNTVNNQKEVVINKNENESTIINNNNNDNKTIEPELNIDDIELDEDSKTLLHLNKSRPKRLKNHSRKKNLMKSPPSNEKINNESNDSITSEKQIVIPKSAVALPIIGNENLKNFKFRNRSRENILDNNEKTPETIKDEVFALDDNKNKIVEEKLVTTNKKDIEKTFNKQISEEANKFRINLKPVKPKNETNNATAENNEEKRLFPALKQVNKPKDYEKNDLDDDGQFKFKERNQSY